MTFFRIVSALLGYPDAALRAALPELAVAIQHATCLSSDERAVLGRFAGRLSAAGPLTAEEEYVSTFDMVPEHSLHLTHHLIGEDRSRGPALIDLTEFFRECGFEIVDKELPDYLPLLLEFASLLETEEALVFLARWNKVLRQLHANLADAASPYAELIGLVEMRSRSVGDDDAAATAPAARKSAACADDENFEPPVNWSPAAACTPSRASPLAPVKLHRRSTAASASCSPGAAEAKTSVHR